MRHVIRLMALLRVALLCHLCVSVAGADRPAPPPAPPIPPSPFTPVPEGKVLGGTVVFDMLVSYLWCVDESQTQPSKRRSSIRWAKWSSKNLLTKLVVSRTLF